MQIPEAFEWCIVAARCSIGPSRLGSRPGHPGSRIGSIHFGRAWLIPWGGDTP